MAQYDYTKTPCSLDRLTQEIQQSSIVTALDHMVLLGDALNVFFKADLSEGDETILDGLVDAHDGTPLSQNEVTNVNIVTDDSVPKDSDGVPLARQRAFANDDGFRFRGKGISGTATKNATTNLDYKVTEARSINNVKLIYKNHVFGDTVKFQIVDVDNIYGYGAGLVLDEFGLDWNLEEDRQGQGQEMLPYRASIVTNLWIRIVYISVGTENDVSLRVNLYLHKKT